MTTDQATPSYGHVPELTLGWRLKMSLGEMTRDQIAETVGYTVSTISRWMADKGAPPRRAVITQWAMATGVDRNWLETGDAPESTNGPEGGESGRRDSNSQHSAWKREGSGSVVRPLFGAAEEVTEEQAA